MMHAVKTFLAARLAELALPNGTKPYEAGAVFFGELPAEYLKDNDYAVACLPLQDRQKRNGRVIARVRDLAESLYRFTRRRYTRELLFRCLIYAERYEDLWGTAEYLGMVDQLLIRVAETRVMADGNGNVIRVDPQDAVRPWNTETEQDRKLRRPHLAIVRISFSGGLDIDRDVPIVPDVTINPHYQGA